MSSRALPAPLSLGDRDGAHGKSLSGTVGGIRMSLDVYLTVIRPCEIYSDNVTHNLGRMAQEAGIYKCLWRPEELGITKATQLIDQLRAGLAILKSDPDRFKMFNPPNGWGSYDGLIKFVEEYLNACGENPEADVSAWR